MRLHIAAAVTAALFLAVCLFSHTVALRLALLGAGIILAASVLAQNRGSVKALPPIWLPFLAWGAWAALSLAWSRDPALTVWEWRNEVFYTAAACWICYVAAQAGHAARIFGAIAAAGATLACGIALYEFSRGWETYAAGLHGGPGDHSSALLALMPCVAMGGWYASRRHRTGLVLAACCLAALLVASAYTTLNRTVWLGFAAQFGVLGFLVLARRPAATPWLLRGAVAGAAVLCLAILAAIQAQREVVGAGPGLEREPRLLLWPQIVEHMRESPVTGYGFGRGMLRDALQAKLQGRDTNLWHAHNVFFDTVLQLGLPGLALLAWLLVATLREAWRRLRDPDDWAAACGMALAAVVVGMLVRNMTDTLLVRQNALLYWGGVGTLLGLTQRLRSRAGNAVTAPVGG
jgi:O-antigen ligase